MVYNWSYSIQQTLYPSRCLLCGGDGDRERDIDLCPACQQELPHNLNPCRCCALPLPPGATADTLCGRCQQRPPPFERTIAPFIYSYPIAELIGGLKFNGKLQHGRMLATLLLEHLLRSNREQLPQLLIPVPLHRKRLQERGFNQAVELARPLSRQLDIPLDFSSCRRVRDTRSQSELHVRERQRNVRGAFKLSGKIEADHVALLDDVVTTGSTVTALAKVLRRTGVGRVDVWALARTP
jgi:ComF family protein